MPPAHCMFLSFIFIYDTILRNWLPIGIIVCSFLFSVTTFLYTFFPLTRLPFCAGGKHVVHRKILWSTQWEIKKRNERGKMERRKEKKRKPKEEKLEVFKYWMNVYINMNIHIHVLSIFSSRERQRLLFSNEFSFIGKIVNL